MTKRISLKDKHTVAEMAAQKAMEAIKQGLRADRAACLKFGLRIARPDVLTNDGGFDLSQAQYEDLIHRFEEQLRYSLIQARIAG